MLDEPSRRLGISTALENFRDAFLYPSGEQLESELPMRGLGRFAMKSNFLHFFAMPGAANHFLTEELFLSTAMQQAKAVQMPLTSVQIRECKLLPEYAKAITEILIPLCLTRPYGHYERPEMDHSIAAFAMRNV